MPEQDLKLNIFTLNPGSTSTKVAWFEGEKKVWEEDVQHPVKELARFKRLFDQLGWRCQMVEAMARKKGMDPYAAQAVVGRGGLMRPVPGGTYKVNAAMCQDLRQSLKRWGVEHASNLGAEMALHFGKNKPQNCFVVDPVATDELQAVARVSGLPGFERRSLLHALNTRAVSRWAAQQIRKPFHKANFVVAHLGGGVSITAVQGGRFIDTTNAVAGQGPMSATRAGSLPSYVLADLAFQPNMDRAKLINILLKKAGLYGYTGTDKLPQVQQMAARANKKAKLAVQALAYQVAKDLAAYTAVLAGKVDGLILTGGMAHNASLVKSIRAQAGFLGRFLIFPGQLEMEAMASGALRVLRGQEKVKTYGK